MALTYGHQNLLAQEMLQKFKPPVWARHAHGRPSRGNISRGTSNPAQCRLAIDGLSAPASALWIGVGSGSKRESLCLEAAIHQGGLSRAIRLHGITLQEEVGATRARRINPATARFDLLEFTNGYSEAFSSDSCHLILTLPKLVIRFRTDKKGSISIRDKPAFHGLLSCDIGTNSLDMRYVNMIRAFSSAE
jgi:hypothetical protein